MDDLLKDPRLQLRPMLEEDLDRVMELELLAYPFPWTHGIFRDCLRAGYCCWLYLHDERLVGYGVMSVAVGEAHLLNLCIHPEWQGHGLGRRLLARLLEIARRRQADTTFLEVRVSNEPARRLYDRAGFNEIGRRRGYYPTEQGREDAIVLALSLL